MIRIEVLGPDCPKCDYTYDRIRRVVDQLKIKSELVKVTDVFQIVDRGADLTPALIIDDELVFQGRVPTKEQLADILTRHSSQEGN